jgi:hypothetical protein
VAQPDEARAAHGHGGRGDAASAEDAALAHATGLIDRYQLVDLLRSLVEAAKDDAAEPILLLVPGHERGVPKIGDTLIPDLLPGQWTWIPKAWIGAQLQFAPG